MTIKQTLIATALFGAIAFAGNTAAQDAIDYSTLSNEQLIQLRSEVRNMSAEDLARFRTEMQSRARNMTPEERIQAGFGPPNAGGNDNGAGQGQQTQKRDGTGNQDRSMDRKRDGSGNKDRTRDGSRYGDGQGSRPRQGGGRGD